MMNQFMAQACFGSMKFRWVRGVRGVINAGVIAACGFLTAGTLSVYAQIPLAGVSQVATGGMHTCALTTNGAVKCWGSNDYGELGNGSQTDSSTAVDVIGLSSNVIAIASGGTHTCALTSGGGVKCWGEGGGKLGDNTTAMRLTPVSVVGLSSGVIAIAAGGNHTCALTSYGGVKCWGYYPGNGVFDRQLAPVDVTGLTSGVASIAAGQWHTCVLTTAGAMKCWGSNDYGQLGDGTVISRYTAVDVVGMGSGVTAISTGYYHTCAIANDQVKCWGLNDFRQVDYSRENRLLPVTVTNLIGNIRSIAAGWSRSCALNANDLVQCWGSGVNADTDTGYVTGLSFRNTNIVAGYHHTCALNGGVKCWGNNSDGQLGNNSRTTLPSQVAAVVSLQAFAPQIGVATAGNTQATVRFNPPSYDSGSPITGYTVTSNPADGIDAYAGTTDSYTGSSELSHLVTGLVNGTSYTFTVTATNALGTGLPSAVSNSVTPSLPTNSSASSLISSSVPSISSVSSSNSSSSSLISSVASASLSSASSINSISSSTGQSSSSFISSVTSSSAVSSFSSSVIVVNSSSTSSSVSSSSNPCANITPTTFGTIYSGSLASVDCTNGARGVSYYTDKYSFTVTAGQQVSILLTSSAFDAYVYLRNSSGTTIASDDDGGGSRNSRIPATSGYYTLSVAGTYTVEVTSYSTFATGAYSLLVSVNTSVASSSSSSTSSSSSSSANTCVSLTAVSGVTNNGALASTDCTNGASGASKYTDRYTFSGVPGQKLSIVVTSSFFDTYVYLKSPNGSVMTYDDDGAGGHNSRIPATSGVYTIPAGNAGSYVIEVTSYSAFETGAYTMLLTSQ